MLYPLLIRDFPDIIEDANDAGFCYAAETYSSVGLGYESHYDTPEENRVDGMVYAAFCLLDAYYNGDGIRAEARYYLTKNSLSSMRAEHGDEFRRGFYSVIDRVLTA